MRATIVCACLALAACGPRGMVRAEDHLPALRDQVGGLKTVLESGAVPDEWSPGKKDALILQGELLVETFEMAAGSTGVPR